MCDGYNSSDQLHFNWGWSGNNDGYYTMNVHDCALRPLHRFVYTDGDILTPNGQIYGIFDWKNTVERLQANPVRF